MNYGKKRRCDLRNTKVIDEVVFFTGLSPNFVITKIIESTKTSH